MMGSFRGRRVSFLGLGVGVPRLFFFCAWGLPPGPAEAACVLQFWKYAQEECWLTGINVRTVQSTAAQ